MHTNERRAVTTTHFLQLFPHTTVRANFTEFLRILQISPMSWASTSSKVLAEIFVEDSDFDLDVADSLSDSSRQVCKTGWQDSVEMTDSFQTLFAAQNTVVTPQIFLSSSFIDSWKVVNEYLLKIEHMVACSLLVLCAKFGGTTSCKSGDNELWTQQLWFLNSKAKNA